MDFTDFAQHTDDCHLVGTGIIVWRLSGGCLCLPRTLDSGGGSLIGHVLVSEGEVALRYGNARYRLAAGDLATFIDKTSMEVTEVSPRARVFLVMMTGGYADTLLRNNPPMPFTYLLRIRRQPVCRMRQEETRLLWRRMTDIREACMDTGHTFRERMVQCAVLAFLLDVADMHVREETAVEHRAVCGTDRMLQVFHTFVKLLGEHVATEHSVAFYADRLCITPQYLGRIVRELSGRTVSGWINFTLVGEIARCLDTADWSMQQIAERFHFADQATLTKFFKRETGYTLTEYRRRKAPVADVMRG